MISMNRIFLRRRQQQQQNQLPPRLETVTNFSPQEVTYGEEDSDEVLIANQTFVSAIPANGSSFNLLPTAGGTTTNDTNAVRSTTTTTTTTAPPPPTASSPPSRRGLQEQEDEGLEQVPQQQQQNRQVQRQHHQDATARSSTSTPRHQNTAMSSSSSSPAMSRTTGALQQQQPQVQQQPLLNDTISIATDTTGNRTVAATTRLPPPQASSPSPPTTEQASQQQRSLFSGLLGGRNDGSTNRNDTSPDSLQVSSTHSQEDGSSSRRRSRRRCHGRRRRRRRQPQRRRSTEEIPSNDNPDGINDEMWDAIEMHPRLQQALLDRYWEQRERELLKAAAAAAGTPATTATAANTTASTTSSQSSNGVSSMSLKQFLVQQGVALDSIQRRNALNQIEATTNNGATNDGAASHGVVLNSAAAAAAAAAPTNEAAAEGSRRSAARSLLDLQREPRPATPCKRAMKKQQPVITTAQKSLLLSPLDADENDMDNDDLMLGTHQDGDPIQSYVMPGSPPKRHHRNIVPNDQNDSMVNNQNEKNDFNSFFGGHDNNFDNDNNGDDDDSMSIPLYPSRQLMQQQQQQQQQESKQTNEYRIPFWETDQATTSTTAPTSRIVEPASQNKSINPKMVASLSTRQQQQSQEKTNSNNSFLEKNNNNKMMPTVPPVRAATPPPSDAAADGPAPVSPSNSTKHKMKSSVPKSLHEEEEEEYDDEDDEVEEEDNDDDDNDTRPNSFHLSPATVTRRSLSDITMQWEIMPFAAADFPKEEEESAIPDHKPIEEDDEIQKNNNGNKNVDKSGNNNNVGTTKTTTAAPKPVAITRGYYNYYPPSSTSTTNNNNDTETLTSAHPSQTEPKGAPTSTFVDKNHNDTNKNIRIVGYDDDDDEYEYESYDSTETYFEEVVVEDDEEEGVLEEIIEEEPLEVISECDDESYSTNEEEEFFTNDDYMDDVQLEVWMRHLEEEYPMKDETKTTTMTTTTKIVTPTATEQRSPTTREQQQQQQNTQQQEDVVMAVESTTKNQNSNRNIKATGSGIRSFNEEQQQEDNKFANFLLQQRDAFENKTTVSPSYVSNDNKNNDSAVDTFMPGKAVLMKQQAIGALREQKDTRQQQQQQQDVEMTIEARTTENTNSNNNIKNIDTGTQSANEKEQQEDNKFANFLLQQHDAFENKNIASSPSNKNEHSAAAAATSGNTTLGHHETNKSVHNQSQTDFAVPNDLLRNEQSNNVSKDNNDKQIYVSTFGSKPPTNSNVTSTSMTNHSKTSNSASKSNKSNKNKIKRQPSPERYYISASGHKVSTGTTETFADYLRRQQEILDQLPRTESHYEPPPAKTTTSVSQQQQQQHRGQTNYNAAQTTTAFNYRQVSNHSNNTTPVRPTVSSRRISPKRSMGLQEDVDDLSATSMPSTLTHGSNRDIQNHTQQQSRHSSATTTTNTNTALGSTFVCAKPNVSTFSTRSREISSTASTGTESSPFQCQCCYETRDAKRIPGFTCDFHIQSHLFCSICIRRCLWSVAETGSLTLVNPIGDKICQVACLCQDQTGCKGIITVNLATLWSRQEWYQWNEQRTARSKYQTGITSAAAITSSSGPQQQQQQQRRQGQITAATTNSSKDNNNTNNVDLVQKAMSKGLKQIQLAMKEALTKVRVRTCPHCHQAFVKNDDGCNKMKCPVCKTTSCFMCRQIVPTKGYDHFHYTANPNKAEKCPLWTDDSADQVHDEEEMRRVLIDLANQVWEEYLRTDVFASISASSSSSHSSSNHHNHHDDRSGIFSASSLATSIDNVLGRLPTTPAMATGRHRMNIVM